MTKMLHGSERARWVPIEWAKPAHITVGVPHIACRTSLCS